MTQNNPNDLARLHIWVTGRVQGVGFRMFVQHTGATFGLVGWVRNHGYDEVETVAEGRRDVLVRFSEVIKTGPRASRVDEARLEWEAWTGEFEGFDIH